MNRIYRLVWNRAMRVMQVASELAGSGAHGSATSTRARHRPRHALALACALALPGASAWAATPTVDTTQPFYDQSSAPLLQNPVVFEGGIFKPTTGLTLSTPITLDTPGGFIDSTNGIVYLGGPISGPGGLTIMAGHGVALTTANTYTGGTTVNNGGILGIQLTLAALPGNVVDNGSIQLEAATGTYAGTISGQGIVQVIVGGTLVLTGNNTAAGGLLIYSGSTVQLGAGGTTGSWGGSGIAVASSLVFNHSNNLTYGGVISDFNGGSGSLTQAGTGTLILTGNNTYTGGTTINTGTLQIGNGGATGTITGNVVDNGTLVFDRSGSLAISGVISGNGSVQQIGSGTTSLTNTNTYNGGTTISAGTLQVTDASSLGTGAITIGTANLTSASSFSTSNAIDVTGSATISAASNLDLSGAVNGSGSLTTNSGTFSANALNINAPLSVTTTAGGITQGGAFMVLGTSSFNAGTNAITLTNAGNAFSGAVSLIGGNVSLANNTATVLGASTVSGTFDVSSNGVLTQTGALTVKGAATFTQNSSGADVDLSGSNDFQNNVTIAGAAINNLSLTNTDATPVTLTLPASVTGNLTLNYTNAALTVPVMAVGGALNVSAANGIVINGNVSTGGAQTYNDTVTLGNNVTLASSGGGAIDFASTLNGAYNLAVNTQNITTFGGAVGGSTALASLTTDAGGLTYLDGNVTTIGAQSYNDVPLLGADVTLASTGNGNISFGFTPGGTHALTITTGGATSFGSVIGGSARLTGLTVNSGTFSANALDINGNLSLKTTGGGIQQSAAFSVTGTSSFDAGLNAITLTNGGNNFGGAVSLSGSGVAITNSNALTLGTLATGPLTAVGQGALNLGNGTINGNLVATSNNGAISQSGALNVSGSFMLDAGSGWISLIDANNFSGAVSAIGGNIFINADGSVLETGSVTGSGTVALSNFNAVTLGGDVTTPGELILHSAVGPIMQTAGAISANTLSGSTTGDVTLTNLNNIATLGDFDARNFSLTDAQPLAITGTLTASGNVTLSDSSGGIIVTGAINAASTTIDASTALNIGSNGGTTGSISGNVVDNGLLAFNHSDAVNFAGAISGSGFLMQNGSGTLTLDGNSSGFTGNTLNSGGLIVGSVAGNGAALGGNVIVSGSGALLGGHGTIGGNVSVYSGAHLAPGDSIGTLTIGGYAYFDQNSQLDFEFGAQGANFQTFGSGDSVVVGGNLSLNGAVLNITDAGGMGAGLYNLFSYGGTLTETNGGIVFGTTPGGEYKLQTLTGSKQINLLNTTGMTLNFWNGNGLASATQLGGGNGSWSATSPNWTDANADITAAMQPQPGFAIFGGAAGTVTIDNSAGNVSATGMQFASNGYILAGGTLSLVGSSGNAPIIRVGDGSAAGANYTATINDVLAGTDGLTKSDLGTLVLTAANTYSGSTTINGGTLETANNAALGSGDVTVDNTANQGATLKVDSGITLANTIAINNGGRLDNAGTISHTAATDIGVQATGGMATVTNHDGGSIAGGVIGLWLHTGGTVINTGSTSSIVGAGYALVTDGSPNSVVTNENGASIHGGTQDSVLMIQGGTLINQSGAHINGDSVAVRMSQNGTIINQGGASISGTGASSFGVILHQGGTITNQGGATIQGGDSAIALAGASTITNAAGSSIIGGNTSVSVFGSGAVNLTNAGVLSGSVYLNSGDANAVTLISGSSLTGSLYIGSNTGSQLTLDGNGTQLYSAAVTGTTSFAGTLTKHGAGSWIVDGDLAPANTVISAGTLQIGNGGSTGSLAGNIIDNAALVSNLSGASTLAGVISGTGSLTQNGRGVLALTGANSYSGGTAINAGSVSVGNNRALGTGTVNMAAGTTVAFASSGLTLANAFILNGDPTYTVASGNTDTLSGVIADGNTPGELLLNGGGTLVLTGANTYTGGTTISAGTLQLGSGGKSGSISGNVTDNGTLAFDRSDAVSFAGVISGSGVLVQNGSGALTLTGANSYTGGTTINAGTLQGDSSSLQGNIADNATLVFNQATAGIYAGSISGTGVLSKTGAGTLTFNGSSPFGGATTVTSGKLVVGDDSHAGASLGGTVTVASGATLGGIGTIGGLNLAGTVTPGNSIGTLHVAGDATFQQGSSYQIEAAPNGSSDQIAATGKVTILGGSAVVLAQAGNWAPRTDYTIITGAQGVSGQFASASSSLLFLNPVLSYTANAVNLSLQRNDINFASVAQTPNQLAVATVTNGLGFVSPMYSALTTLDAPTARHAFDQLSGEIHASTSTALVDDSRYVREAINRHLLGLNDGTEGTTAQGISAWTSAWGHGGHHDDDGNAASLQANGSGLLVGADLSLGSNSRLGAVVGHGQNSIRENSLGSSTHVLGDHVGLYGSSSFGAFVLRGGMAYARQDVHSNRAVAFGTYSDWLSSEHHAQTAQAYVEGGYQFNMSPGQQLEPFVNVARVRVHSDALQEGGGNAALAVAGNSASVNTATLGLRDTLTLDAAGGIHAHASLGYQQAWGDLSPVTTMRFVTGGDSFAVAGTPVARHAFTTDLGIDFKLAKNVSVDASYLGQFASGVQDQGARMSLTVTL